MTVTSQTDKATCEEDGKTVYTAACAFHGKDYTTSKTVTIGATGHDWDGGKVTKEPTCTEKGERTLTCNSCHVTKTRDIAANGHDWEWIIDKEATETEAGSKHEECTVCHEKKESVEIPATGQSTGILSISSAEGVDAGSEVEVRVSIANNPGLWGGTVKITYDKALEFIDCTGTELLGDSVQFEYSTSGNVITLMWDNSKIQNSTANGDLAVIKVKVPADATVENQYEISFQEVDLWNKDEDQLELDTTNGTITVNTCVIKASATEGGSIDPSGTVKVKEGEDKKFTIAVREGYHLKDVTVDGESVGKVTTYTFSNVHGAHTIAAAFEEHSYTPVVTDATCTENGHTTYTCACGDSYTEVIPAKGHTSDGNTDCSKETRCTECHIVLKEAGEHAWNEGEVTKEPTCTENGSKLYTCGNCGATKTETIPAAHKWGQGVVTKEPTCTEKGVRTYTCSVCGATKTEEIATVAHQYGSDGKCTVCGAAKPAGGGGGGGGGREYDITVEKSAHGTVTAEWESAMKGDTVTLTVKPDKGYKLETLSVAGKGGSVVKVNEKNGVYSFDMPAYAVVVKATFVEENGPAVTNTFVDVKSDAYYYDAVLWAAQNGITGGKDDTHFAPNETCTRAQAVTFLWRAAGSPAPKSTVNPFVDMKPGAYYYDAVLWAVENGITKGTTDTTFSPNATCSRAQIVTFLWRSQKSPAAGTVNPFTDVAAGTYYNNAVLWAVKNGITGGTTATTFSPNNNCTRAQIVTFLYRNVNG